MTMTVLTLDVLKGCFKSGPQKPALDFGCVGSRKSSDESASNCVFEPNLRNASSSSRAPVSALNRN